MRMKTLVNWATTQVLMSQMRDVRSMQRVGGLVVYLLSLVGSCLLTEFSLPFGVCVQFLAGKRIEACHASVPMEH